MLVAGALAQLPAGGVIVGAFTYVCKPGRRYTCSYKHGTSNRTITGLPKVVQDDREGLTGNACQLDDVPWWPKCRAIMWEQLHATESTQHTPTPRDSGDDELDDDAGDRDSNQRRPAALHQRQRKQKGGSNKRKGKNGNGQRKKPKVINISDDDDEEAAVAVERKAKSKDADFTSTATQARSTRSQAGTCPTHTAALPKFVSCSYHGQLMINRGVCESAKVKQTTAAEQTGGRRRKQSAAANKAEREVDEQPAAPSKKAERGGDKEVAVPIQKTGRGGNKEPTAPKKDTEAGGSESTRQTRSGGAKPGKRYQITYDGLPYDISPARYQMYKRLLYLHLREPQPGELRPPSPTLRRWFELMAAQWAAESFRRRIKERWEPDWGHVAWSTRARWLVNPYNGEHTLTRRRYVFRGGPECQGMTMRSPCELLGLLLCSCPSVRAGITHCSCAGVLSSAQLLQEKRSRRWSWPWQMKTRRQGTWSPKMKRRTKTYRTRRPTPRTSRSRWYSSSRSRRVRTTMRRWSSSRQRLSITPQSTLASRDRSPRALV